MPEIVSMNPWQRQPGEALATWLRRLDPEVDPDEVWGNPGGMVWLMHLTDEKRAAVLAELRRQIVGINATGRTVQQLRREDPETLEGIINPT